MDDENVSFVGILVVKSASMVKASSWSAINHSIIATRLIPRLCSITYDSDEASSYLKHVFMIDKKRVEY